VQKFSSVCDMKAQKAEKRVGFFKRILGCTNRELMLFLILFFIFKILDFWGQT
jgi:hypothetical protein